MTKTVILPQTYLSGYLSATLAHCFDEVHVLRPSGITEEVVNDKGELPGEFKILEAVDNDDDIGLESRTLKNLMHQWERFITSQHRDGTLATIQAGIRPRQPDLEKTRAIVHLITGNAEAEKQPPKPPSASPALLLKLAHFMDQKAADLRSMALRADAQQEHLSELFGSNQGDETPAEFQKGAPCLIGPMGLEMEDESLASYRLQAWACMAPVEKIKDHTPLTLSPQAAVLLLERANIFMGGKPIRSAAGVQSLLWPPVSLSIAGASLAREALRLRLPLPEEAHEFKTALGMMIEAVGQAPMSTDLLRSLEEIGGAWLESGGPQRSGGRMGLMVFPGYSMAGLVKLMKGHASEPELPEASCPLWVVL